MFCWPWPVLPTWPCFVLSVLEGQLSNRVLGGDVTAVLVTATLTFTSSWWISEAVTIHRTCCVGLCRTDYPLLMICSHTVLISLFQMERCTVTMPGQVDCISDLKEMCLCKEKQGKEVDWLMQQWGLSANRGRVIMATQKHAYTKKKTQAHTAAGYFIYIFYRSQMDGTNVLSFFQSHSALLYVCGVTCSLEMALAPSSQGRNHLVEWQTQHREAGRIWIALRQTLLTQVFLFLHPLPTLPWTYTKVDSILSAFSPGSCNNKRCCPAVKHCQ